MTRSFKIFPQIVLSVLTVVIFFICQPNAPAQTATSNSLVASWLAAQTKMQTWSADFTQIRSLKALTEPLTASGHVWFAAPNSFRWEVRQPSQTTAVRQGDEMLVIYPKLKRAERYQLNSSEAGQFKDTLALLDAGFPRSRAEVDSRFNVISLHDAAGIEELALQPKSETARRFMPQIVIGFDTNSFALHSTELEFQDGSTMRNVFTNAQLNPPIDEKLFHPDISGYKIVEPFKK